MAGKTLRSFPPAGASSPQLLIPSSAAALRAASPLPALQAALLQPVMSHPESHKCFAAGRT